MYCTTLATVAALLLASATAFTPARTNGTDALYFKGLDGLKQHSIAYPSASNCSLRNAHIRKEWSALKPTEKKAYLDAVLCLQSKPALTTSWAPGSKSRYDDFVAIHVSQTLTIHATGNFLSWHRYFVYTYEKALREECGYTGFQPYINWGKYSKDLANAPIFDGSDISLGGNGVYANYSGLYFPTAADPSIYIPPGVGGGCITSGPFRNMSVNLGPVAGVVSDIPANPQPDGFGYNPRCLRRDLGIYIANISTTDADSVSLITQNTNILSFQNTMQGDFPNGLIGVHTGGHYWVGGDPGGDFFTSPGDPFFWFHHAQIDRTWWIWQNQDLQNRLEVIAGTVTMFNEPPSRNATLDDVLDLGVLAENITIRDAVSTFDGPFCYIYV